MGYKTIDYDAMSLLEAVEQAENLPVKSLIYLRAFIAEKMSGKECSLKNLVNEYEYYIEQACKHDNVSEERAREIKRNRLQELKEEIINYLPKEV